MSRSTQLFGLAALSAALLLAACGKTDTAESLLAAGKAMQQQGDYRSAIIQLKNSVQKDPANAEARFVLGELYNRVGDPLSAEKEIRKAMAMGLQEKALPQLLISLLLQSKFKQVLDDTETIAYTASAEVSGLRGSAFLGLDRVKEAQESFERALVKNPGDAHSLIGLAKISFGQNDKAATAAYVARAVEKNPKDLDTLLYKGELERVSGQPDAALASFDAILAVDPSNSGALLRKVGMLVELRKYEEANATLAKVRKVAPNNLMASYAQAMIDYSQGKFPAALESLQQVLRAVPDHMPSLLLAGLVQYQLGSYPQAEKHLKAYVEANPENSAGRKFLATARISTKDYRGALAALAPVLDTTDDVEILMVAGKAHMELQEYAKSTAYLEKASRLNPKAARVRTSLGLSRYGQGQQDTALEELELATVLDKNSIESGLVLAMTSLRLTQYDKALQALLKLEQKSPQDPLVLNMLGAAYLGKQDLARARASFEKAAAARPAFFPAVDNLARMDATERNFDGARKRYEAFLAVNKGSGEAMKALGAIALAQKRTSDATAMFEQAQKAEPDAVEPAVFLASHYMQLGAPMKALTLLRKIQTSHPNNADVLSLVGQLQFGLGEIGASMETFNKLTVVTPQAAVAHYQLGAAHMGMHNLPAAHASLKRAISLQPDFPAAQMAMANVLVQQGQFDEAALLARQLQKSHPTSSLGYATEADVLVMQKKDAGAVPLYEKAYALDKSAELLLKLYGAMQAVGKDKDAELKIAQWRKEHPDDNKVPAFFAERYMLQGKYAEAVVEIKQILQRVPDYPPALNNLALAYLRTGDARALQIAEQAYKLAPANANVMDTLGLILLDKGESARALTLLQQASAKSPGSAEIRYHLATALAKSPDKAAAKKELEYLVLNHKNTPQAEQARTLLKGL